MIQDEMMIRFVKDSGSFAAVVWQAGVHRRIH